MHLFMSYMWWLVPSLQLWAQRPSLEAGQRTALSLFVSIKFYWHTVTPIHLHVGMAALSPYLAELDSYNRNRSLKY